MIEIDGASDDWFRQRVKFLESRANAHLKEHSNSLRHLVCAATLLRDAGCVLLLREQTGLGGEYLIRAGELLLELGLPAGLPLIGLSDSRRGQEEAVRYREMIQSRSSQGISAEGETPADPAKAIALGARHSFRSMVSLVQAGQLGAAVDRTGKEGPQRREMERERLREIHGFRIIGNTGLSVARYVRVCAWMEEPKTSQKVDDVPVDVRRSLEFLGRHRDASIEAAQNDKFHWMLVSRPAELLDLDTMVLMRLVLNAGYRREQIMGLLGWNRGDVLGAPLDVAAAPTRFGRDRGPGLSR